MEHILTSEAVGAGHPDKLADQISDAVLDAALSQDERSRVACEVLLAKDVCIIAGEITSKAKLDYEQIARKTIIEAGYNNSEIGFDGNACQVLVYVSEQSTEISSGVNEYDPDDLDSLGAGDQGIVFGYATAETEEMLPLPYVLAQALTSALGQYRQDTSLPYLRPDNKTQVSVVYNEKGTPIRVSKVLISTQHDPDISQDQLRKDLLEKVTEPVLGEWYREDIEVIINPAGPWSFGGPAADTGLTGRKIIVDTYGGGARHGGGAFSGKDPSKVDRSGAYAARFIAKTIVAAGLAFKCEVQLGYAIGDSAAFSINIETFGTEAISREVLVKVVNKYFDIRPAAIIKRFDLLRPIYSKTAVYGHFTDPNLPWECVDVDALELRILAVKTMHGIEVKNRTVYEDERGVYELCAPCMTCKNYTIPVSDNGDNVVRALGRFNCPVCGQHDQYLPVWITARANYHARARRHYIEHGYVSLDFGPLRDPLPGELPEVASDKLPGAQTRHLRAQNIRRVYK